ncbi:RNB domain-containing ribonuclease [Thermoleophilum album]|uniref:RNB domain-containing ribonuclease n=1 Tax=Thermoleophilum album TaxID=29539 RepID=UPI001C40A4B4|nr:RNB domain-containing ribonuclease [Thermoleophilum album]
MPARARGPERRPVVGVVKRRGRLLTLEPLFHRGLSAVLTPGGRVRFEPGDVIAAGPGRKGFVAWRRIGRPDSARDVVEALLVERGHARSYPRAAEREARAVARSPHGRAPRVDLRELPTFTIDPAEAKDFDDAISARVEGDGRVRVWVHVADVTAFVRPGGALDEEARRRATSVYAPGTVEPMLPHVLSSGECSLRPGEDRLAVTVELEMDEARVRKARFMRTLIRSDARLTYDQVDRVFAGRERAQEPWAEPLAAARRVARALRDRRRRRGGLEIDSAEPRFEFDAEGRVRAVTRERQTESHWLIEELMVLANEQVAGYLEDHRVPTIYRIHERPDLDAIERLADQLASIDVPTPPLPDRLSPQQAERAAGAISRRVAAYARRSGRGREAFPGLVLRALKQAVYSPRNVGHSGLASSRYCHFTSPIRRYPDIVVHRALLQALGLDDAAHPASELPELAIHCSAREREAMEIERDADDICLAFRLEDIVAESWSQGGHANAGGPCFEGEVVGLIERGAFVRFGPEGFDGFLPLRRLPGWYDLNELGTVLIGRGAGARAIRLGDPLKVAVERVDPPRGHVDLLPAWDL